MEKAGEEERNRIMERHSIRLRGLGDESGRGYSYAIQLEKSTYTQKPVVGKLNPMLVLGVRLLMDGGL